MQKKTMNQKTFERFKGFIEKNIGICIPQAKKVMVESRLLKRLRYYSFETYEEYCSFFFSVEGQKLEVPRFIEEITTNKTDFFREVDHFYFLRDHALPQILDSLDNKEIRLWSAASSTGEEAYTLGIFMEEFIQGKKGFTYKILATDISEKVLDIGTRAVYPLKDGDPIPKELKKKYCLLSKDKLSPTLRIKKQIRDKVMFRHINLTSDSYLIKKKYHIIFLRNVMIYFNRETQKDILLNLYEHLHPSGFLFLGHSENLPDNSLPFKRVGPSIYIKKE